MRTLSVLLLAAPLTMILAACGGSGGSTDDTPATAGGGAAGGAGGSGGGAGGDAGAGGEAAKPAKRAAGVAITQVALYQGVKVPLMLDWAAPAKNAPVIRGRDSIMRVFVAPLDGWQQREVVVKLEMISDDGPTLVKELQGTVAAASVEEQYETTVNFAIPGENIGTNTQYAVTISEVSPDVAITGDSSKARWPEGDGGTPFGEQKTNDALKMVIVPIQYNGDGSGRTPDLNEGFLEGMRAHMQALYPTPKVEISVTGVLPYSKKVAPTDDNAWSDILSAVLNKRNADKVGPEVYYYGVFLPAASIFSYCGGGCIAGLTFGGGNGMTYPGMRGSVGLGYPGQETSETFVHEIGHAHGLPHAPCAPGNQISGVDPKYPYKNAKIGVWGMDVAKVQLKGPQAFVDMMSYCSPTWISDYYFGKLAAEIRKVNKTPYEMIPPGFPSHLRVVLVDSEGAARLGDRIETQGLPNGEPREVTLLDAAGKPIKTVTGWFYPASHGKDGTGAVLVPDDVKMSGAIVKSITLQ